MKKIAVVLFLFYAGLTANAQYVKVFEFTGGPEPDSLGELSIVDINSSLEVRVDVKSLSLKLSEETKSHPELQKKLALYASVLEYQIDIQKMLKTEFPANADLTERLAKLNEFSVLANKMYDVVFSDDALVDKFDAYGMAFNKLNADEKAKWGNYYLGWALYQLNEEMLAGFDSIKNSLSLDQVTIQVLAYIHTNKESYKRVHIDNFDKFSTGEFTTIQRFATSFSEEDLAALEYNQKLSNTLNEMVASNFANFSGVLKTELKSYTCIEDLLAEVKQLLARKNELVGENKAEVELLLQNVQREFLMAQTLIQKIEKFDLSAPNAFVALSTFQFELKSLYATIFEEAAATNVSLLEKAAEANAQLGMFKTNFLNCTQQIKADLQRLENMYAVAANVINPGANTVKTGKLINDAALKFSLDNIPEKGFIDLRTAGKREDHDKLEIQLKVIRPENIEQGEIIEKKTITMLQVKVHSISNISLILASPYNFTADVVRLENKFQFAPAGNLLFKKGSRTSKTWNFINPGLGFTMSTPDFDLDGVPEVGVGAVATLLNDVLSFGISYNTKTDNPYWFFGLSLPFNMMGLPVNTVEVEKVGN